MNSLPPTLSRRRFVTGAAAAGALASIAPVTGIAAQQQPPKTLRGRQFNLDIGYQRVNFTGLDRLATCVNGSVPAPTLYWKEGDTVTLNVTNHLAEDSSIHWHGMILPSGMDGVPGLSFAGIKPGQTFSYQFDINQNGTYWYHSHSGFQEQTGLYGAIVIEPRDPEPISYQRDYVITLSDWSDENPHHIYHTLKKVSHYYNFNERTLSDWWREVQKQGFAETWRERQMWNAMRMKASDIADVTAYTYTYLMNGVTPEPGWQGLFKAGERIRLRFINASAMTLFDVRIPGLKMTVVASDGQFVDPITVDEFRIATAETYDVIVEPDSDRPYCVFAQSIDRSGYAIGNLTPHPSLRAELPDMDPAPVLSHRDMGMDMGTSMAMGDAHANVSGAKHDQHHHARHMDASGGHDSHGSSGMIATPSPHSPAPAGFGSQRPILHPSSESGPQVDMRAAMPTSGLHDPGIGLRQHPQRYGRRVLNYGDLRNLTPTGDRRDPEREIQIHLTGNMARYMWSMDGLAFPDAEPIQLRYGERIRLTLVNDTMMTHPIHLHGLWSELETGDPEALPKKHTIMVHPGSTISYLVTADAIGRWAYHCHLLYHMPGMMREVRVTRGGQS